MRSSAEDLYFLRSNVDFGLIERTTGNREMLLNFVLVNKRDKPVKIKRISKACSCFEVKAERDYIGSRDTTNIEILISKDFAPDIMSYSIAVETDCGEIIVGRFSGRFFTQILYSNREPLTIFKNTEVMLKNSDILLVCRRFENEADSISEPPVLNVQSDNEGYAINVINNTTVSRKDRGGNPYLQLTYMLKLIANSPVRDLKMVNIQLKWTDGASSIIKWRAVEFKPWMKLDSIKKRQSAQDAIPSLPIASVNRNLIETTKWR